MSGHAIRLFVALACCLAQQGCNSTKQYSAIVYKVGSSELVVNITFLLGREHGWPNARDGLKLNIETAALAALKKRGIPVESCLIIKYTPYQSGQMGVTLVAGTKAALTRWAALSGSALNDELLRNEWLEVVRFDENVDLSNPVESQGAHDLH